MPILLKKPFSIGDLAPEGSEGYRYATLTSLVHNGLTFGVMVEYEYGEASGAFLEHWVKGPGSPTRIMDVPPQEVAAMWGQMPKEGESIGEAMRRVTYEYMIAHGVDGEIMNNPPLPPQEMKQETPAEPEAPAEPTPEPEPEAPTETPAGETADGEPQDGDSTATEPPAEAPADGEAEPVPSPS